MSPSINRLTRLLVAAMLFTAVVTGESRAAGIPARLVDGWHAWRVASNDPQATRCCYSWSIGRPTQKTCNLERINGMSMVHDNARESSDETQVYTLVRSGKAIRIAALSPQCPVSAPGEINDLGLVDATESLAWLDSFVGSDGELGEDALAAIAAHDGALAALVTTVENRNLDMELREQALYWMAQSNSDEAFDYLAALISGDSLFN